MGIMGRLGAAKGPALGFLSLGLAGCAVSTPASVTTVQQAPGPVTALAFVSEEDESGIRSQFKSDLVSAFASRGVGMTADADHLADFTVSQRPADLALQEVTSDDANASAPATDYRPRWFHKCKPNRVSASLLVYAKGSGTIHAKSQGEFVACPGDMSQLDDLAELLAERTLQN